MPIAVGVYSQFRGFAIAPEDVDVSPLESQEVTVNVSGVMVKVPLTRKALKVTIKGITSSQASSLQQEARNNRKRLIQGAVAGENITIGQHVLSKMILIEAVPTPLPITIQGYGLIEGIVLTYHSLIFEY